MKNVFRNAIYSFIAVAAMTTTVPAQAQTNNQLSETAAALRTSTEGAQDKGFSLYGGLGAGMIAPNSDAAIEGAGGSVKLVGSFLNQSMKWAFDLGLGVATHKFSDGKAAATSSNGGIGELAARYRFAPKWQLGMNWNTMFNQGTGYAANQGDAQFLGVQVLREMKFFGNYKGRLGGRVMTDANVSSANALMAMLDLHMTFGKDAAAPSEPMVSETRIAPAVVEQKSDVKLVISRFEINSDKMSATDLQRVKKFAETLSQMGNKIEKIEVSGHADETGPEALNQKLSNRRAQAIARALEAAGVPRSKLLISGAGSQNPAVVGKTKADYSKNRRTELKLIGTDTESLKSIEQMQVR